MFDLYIDKAKNIVNRCIDDELKERGILQEYELYLEEFHVLKGSWRALFRTSLSNSVSYELMYDKDRRETIIRNVSVVKSRRMTDREYDPSIYDKSKR